MNATDIAIHHHYKVATALKPKLDTRCLVEVAQVLGNYPQFVPSDLQQVSSSSYDLRTRVAALYCFLAMETFEEGPTVSER
jgi:hypothetical protein